MNLKREYNRTPKEEIVIRSTTDVTDYEKRYKHQELCANCSKLNTFYILKGTTIKNAIFMQKCENCGCYMSTSLK